MTLKAYATEIVHRLSAEGYIAYFAGGWVRDYLLNHPSFDIDIATDAPTQVILDLFPHTILVGLAFGVVIVVKDGIQFEVATFRRDIGYVNGRKPQQVEMSSPREDALRRDFTINGMFYDPIKDEIFDYVGGIADLKKGVIRAIGNPHERFIEDRLRMIRAVRFAGRLEFLIDPPTRDAIIENADTLFPPVAIERVWQELKKMAEGPRFDHSLLELHSCGLLEVIFPVLKGVHHGEIKKRIAPLAHFPKECPAILQIELLFLSFSLEERIELCQMLRVSNREIELVRCADECRCLMLQPAGDYRVAWAYFYARASAPEILAAVIAGLPFESQATMLEWHSLNQRSLAAHIERLVMKKPLVTSAHLKEQGIEEGKLMGVLLRDAEILAIEEDFNDSSQLIDRLKASSDWPASMTRKRG